MILTKMVKGLYPGFSVYVYKSVLNSNSLHITETKEFIVLNIELVDIVRKV